MYSEEKKRDERLFPCGGEEREQASPRLLLNKQLQPKASSSDLLAFQKLTTRKTSRTIQDSIDAFLQNPTRHEQDDDLRISADRKQIFP
jgi:hypothetical protein